MSAIEVPIPKEIREYEAKLVGPFTARKLICSTIACACSAGVYFLQKSILGMETPSSAPCVIAAIPAALFMFKPYGLKMEVFLKAAFIDNVLAPKERPYIIDNPLIEALENIEEVESENEEENKDENSSDIKKRKVKKKKKKNDEKPTPIKKLPPELRPFK